MIDALDGTDRLVLKAELEPTVGSTFQPTGFPDLGPAEFQRPAANGEGTESALLVESVQSVANRLEELGWNAPNRQPAETLQGLPYVRVEDEQETFLTSSRLEPHRLASAYIKDAELDGQKVGDWMVERLGVTKGVPTDWQAVYEGILQLDPLNLLHGVFFSDPNWRHFGNPKVRRAITGVIEAHDVRPVVSGGVKRDDVRPAAGEERGGAEEGYGFVPFGRTEYTAREIQLALSIDLEQIRGYGLDEEATRLLVLIGLWEIASHLEAPIRLRTACDLETRTATVTRPEGFELPSADDLAGAIRSMSIDFERREPWTVMWKGKK